MKIRKILLINLLLTSGLVLSGQSIAVTGNGTPTNYSVDLQQVEFHQVGTPSTTFFPYRTGSSSINIASVSPNEPCASLGPSGTPPAGQYDQFRVTVSKNMTITGASNGVLSNGLPCRTVANGAAISDPFGDGSVSVAYLGATDGGTPEAETVTVPSGSGVVLPSGFVAVGDTIQATFPVNFSVTNAVPQSRVTFNVTNAVLFQAINLTQCVVVPMPPSISISIA